MTPCLETMKDGQSDVKLFPAKDFRIVLQNEYNRKWEREKGATVDHDREITKSSKDLKKSVYSLMWYHGVH